MTPETVRALWTYLQLQYKTKVTHKQDALEMRALARVLPAGFLDRYTTTIGRLIYTPFEVGEPNENWSLNAQIAVAAHEHQHVVQLDRDGLSYMSSYLLSSRKRAEYEIEAYRATLEVTFFLTGRIETEHYADGLRNYGCGKTDVELARETLARYAEGIRNGDVMTEAGQRTVFFLCR